MIKKISAFLLAVAALSCGEGELKKAEDAQDAGRQFIRASLDGDYKKAKFYLLKDEDNLRLIEKQQTNYQRMSGEEKRLYRESTIRPVAITKVSDSLTRYSYYHTSNPKDTTTLSVVRVNDEWLVDLKSIISQK